MMIAPSQFYWLSIGTGFFLASAASIWELKTSTIPNYLTLVTLVFGLILGFFDHLWAFHLTGFFFAAAPVLLAYHRGYVGGGLTKLLAAVGTLCGSKIVILMFLPMILIFGFLAYRAARKGSSPEIVGSPIILSSLVLATLASQFIP